MTKSQMINLKVEPEFHQQLKRKSEETGVAVLVVMRRALEVWLVTGEIPKIPEQPKAKPKREKP